MRTPEDIIAFTRKPEQQPASLADGVVDFTVSSLILYEIRAPISTGCRFVYLAEIGLADGSPEGESQPLGKGLGQMCIARWGQDIIFHNQAAHAENSRGARGKCCQYVGITSANSPHSSPPIAPVLE